MTLFFCSFILLWPTPFSFDIFFVSFYFCSFSHYSAIFLHIFRWDTFRCSLNFWICRKSTPLTSNVRPKIIINTYISFWVVCEKFNETKRGRKSRQKSRPNSRQFNYLWIMSVLEIRIFLNRVDIWAKRRFYSHRHCIVLCRSYVIALVINAFILFHSERKFCGCATALFAGCVCLLLMLFIAMLNMPFLMGLFHLTISPCHIFWQFDALHTPLISRVSGTAYSWPIITINETAIIAGERAFVCVMADNMVFRTIVYVAWPMLS